MAQCLASQLTQTLCLDSLLTSSLGILNSSNSNSSKGSNNHNLSDSLIKLVRFKLDNMPVSPNLDSLLDSLNLSSLLDSLNLDSLLVNLSLASLPGNPRDNQSHKDNSSNKQQDRLVPQSPCRLSNSKGKPKS